MFSLTHCIEDVIKFHTKFGITTPTDLNVDVQEDLVNFRALFLTEELNEFQDASLFLIPNSPSTNCDFMQADASDALIDLIYIVAGTLAIHGITSVDEAEYFEAEYVMPVPLYLENSTSYCYDTINGEIEEIKQHIAQYKESHSSLLDICTPLLFISARTKYIAQMLGITSELWNELWNDVQRANMSKVRATSASQSKRNSAYDIIKPHDWQPPQSSAILKKHQDDAFKMNVLQLQDLDDETVS